MLRELFWNTYKPRQLKYFGLKPRRTKNQANESLKLCKSLTETHFINFKTEIPQGVIL